MERLANSQKKFVYEKNISSYRKHPGVHKIRTQLLLLLSDQSEHPEYLHFGRNVSKNSSAASSKRTTTDTDIALHQIDEEFDTATQWIEQKEQQRVELSKVRQIGLIAGHREEVQQ
ncbi:hypothetical protein WR25_11222 [Diploscapter pachys]|uniref:Uncharacterized protein n=1 Tax=Diploscapter pachys TaxID=2018661 RepID=A0A2A2M2W0_9BILA|nr:hypothetical protein WR25_11222 [Diploscapter pachys]